MEKQVLSCENLQFVSNFNYCKDDWKSIIKNKKVINLGDNFVSCRI